MPTLAPKLPWQHPFAGGYPGRGGQPLPTDADAIDYLNRLAAVDGAAVEVGIAQAIDAFVRGCKADSAGYAGDPTRSNWDAIQASCIMCGARTLSGALVPLKGTAPTPYNFASGDYSRSGATPGLKGDGTTKYLDTNYAYAQNQDDEHLAIYRTVAGTGNWIGGGRWAGGAGPYSRISFLSPTAYRSSQGTDNTGGFTDTLGFFATGRSNGTQSQLRAAGTTTTAAALSNPVAGVTASYGVYAAIFDDIGVFFRSPQRAAFYSVGSAIDLAAMDERVTNLVTAIKFHSLTGLLPNDYDPATIAYITAAYAAGGTL